MSFCWCLGLLGAGNRRVSVGEPRLLVGSRRHRLARPGTEGGQQAHGIPQAVPYSLPYRKSLLLYKSQMPHCRPCPVSVKAGVP